MKEDSIIVGAGGDFWRIQRKFVTPKQFQFLLNHSMCFGITSIIVDDKAMYDRIYPNQKPFDFDSLRTVNV